MGNILTANVKIRGTRELWWHWFNPDTSIPLEKRERTGVAGNDPQEWRSTVLYTSSGQLFVQDTYIFGAIVEAARYTKKGRGSIQNHVAATLQVQPGRILIDRFIPGFDNGLPKDLPTDPSLPVYLDVRGVTNPGTKGKNIRYRVAATFGWQAEFLIMWDGTIVSREQMNAVVIDAGNIIGIGNGRSIGRGRFEIIEFIVE